MCRMFLMEVSSVNYVKVLGIYTLLIVGTISVDFDGNIDLNTPIKEFYRLPLKQKNEITVLVQATTDARILLSDDNTNPDITPVPVEIVIGGKGNTSLSVGLAQDDGTGKYPKEVVQTPKLLSATHWKAFSIRWYYGRVMVYNHGYQKPIITWDGPKDGSVSFSQIGVRTVGCSGQWRVQGLPKFNTADGDAYKKMDIYCGRLDFEVSAWRDAYIQFVSKPEAAGTAPRIHCVLGYGDPRSFSAVFLNGNAVSPVQETVPTLSTNEYRRFWFKWDCNNFMVRSTVKNFWPASM